MDRHFLLVDATGLIFRAYYSIKGDFRTEDGTVVNAVFGLMRMMMRLFRDVPATASAIVFDAGAKTFRNEMFSEYKSHRPPPPDDLKPQFELCQNTAITTGAPVFSMAGFEADDIIATIAGQAVDQGYKASILTSDKDILQLLSPDINIIMPAKGGDFNINTVKSFEEKYGFPISRFTDFKAIMGDPSDNIPGIKGIGEKGAAKLVSTYGRLEQIYANLDMVKPAGVKKKLADEKDEVFLYRDLVTLKNDVPIKYDFSDRTLPDFGRDELIKLLAGFGFSKVIEDARSMGDLMADIM